MSRRRDDQSGASKPRPIADLLREVLRVTGLERDVSRAGVLQAWPALVGAQIAAVTQPRTMGEDGTLVVGVKTNAWMNELSLMERQLIAKLTAAGGPTPVKRIRWELLR